MKRIVVFLLSVLVLTLTACQSQVQLGESTHGKLLTRREEGLVVSYRQTEYGLVMDINYGGPALLSIRIIDSTEFSSDRLRQRIMEQETGFMVQVTGQIPAKDFDGIYLAMQLSEKEIPTQATVQPTTQPAPQPTQTNPPETEPEKPDLWIFRYSDIYTEDFFKHVKVVPPDLSNCTIGHLYYFYYTDTETGDVHTICDEPVLAYHTANDVLYFAKEAESTKLYCTPVSDLTQHTAVYESDYGAINYISSNWPYLDVLTLTEGNKRGVLLDLSTGEIDVLIEQYYIHHASVEDLHIVDGTRSYNTIWFRGKLNEEDSQKDYLYYIDTGEIIESYYQ